MSINQVNPRTNNVPIGSLPQIKVNEIPIGDQFRFLTKNQYGDKSHPIDLGQEYNVTIINPDTIGHGNQCNYLDLCKRNLLTNSILLELPKLALEAILDSPDGLSDEEMAYYIPENIQVQFLSNTEIKGILKGASDLQNDYKKPTQYSKSNYNKGYVKCKNAYCVGKILEKMKQAVNLDDPDLNALINELLTLKKEATLKAAVRDFYAFRLKFKLEEALSVAGPKLTFEKDLTERVNRGSKRKGYEADADLRSSKFPLLAAPQVNPVPVQTSEELNPLISNDGFELSQTTTEPAEYPKLIPQDEDYPQLNFEDFFSDPFFEGLLYDYDN